ncbi:MAG: proline--tRNA ligase [Desulfatibacillaceae bacterium]
MGKKAKNAISPTRSEDYPEWYQQVVRASDMAERSVVRGCMVIKPWGYAVWENLSRSLDDMFKATGVRNAYFPIFIPLRFLEREAKHVEGFATECAVVTHHRLEKGEDGGLVPAGRLQEPLVVRPTSETIIGESFARWVESYRDLPMLLNQWANVVRWEMRPRVFLRTSEFLWQEGHTVHATREEAEERTLQMLNVYADLAENFLAMPVLKGRKTEAERFPGAVDTMCIEAMMQDRKALQAGTSHFLGQNFAKASGIQFQSEKGELEFAWTTSWGVSTRLIGGLIMTHADDDGVVIPPKVSPSHVVLMPILKDPDKSAGVMEYTNALADELRQVRYHGKNVVVEVDDRDIGGAKGWEWIKKGIPVRAEIGPRDMAENAVFMARRDLPANKKTSMPRDRFVAEFADILDDIQHNLFQAALDNREQNTRTVDGKSDFYDYFTPSNPEERDIHGGFALSHWCGGGDCEARIKEDLAVTIRLVPFDQEREQGECVCCGKPSEGRVVFAKSY